MAKLFKKKKKKMISSAVFCGGTFQDCFVWSNEDLPPVEASIEGIIKQTYKANSSELPGSMSVHQKC